MRVSDRSRLWLSVVGETTKLPEQQAEMQELASEGRPVVTKGRNEENPAPWDV